ncbi:hypothetical protein CDCA_CDCA06G1817 [Cyanidium caldarium]|uniref:DUF423 domain-containing protein n=1 Tax=Cyanidium caldarium TaxID=2771 RepID=A0AAV9IU48_CYACA|nr:hypothetical protein CDCA_CDCA06G1817 [Cyanidium caldarium]
MLPFLSTAAAVQRLAGASGALAVALGAFGAHGLQKRVADPRLFKSWETGASYHLAHSVALGLAAHGGAIGAKPARLAAACFTAGIALFSGSLYAMTLTGNRQLGAITPFGGAAFILGWLALAARK